MKTQIKRKFISAILVTVMIFMLVPISALNAFAAGGTENVDFAIKESWGVYFEQTGLNRKYPIVLTNENKLSLDMGLRTLNYSGRTFAIQLFSSLWVAHPEYYGI